MSLNRQLKRNKLKQEWKVFKKSNKEYNKIPFGEFHKLWTASMLGKSKQDATAAILTEEQESELSDILMEEVIEDEDEDSITE